MRIYLTDSPVRSARIPARSARILRGLPQRDGEPCSSCPGSDSVTSEMTHEKNWCAELVIRRARSLGRFVEEIEKTGKEREPPDTFLLEGSILAAPVLLSLATELALKAWQCRERNGTPDRTHDLLKLFDGLTDNAQDRPEDKEPETRNPLVVMPIFGGMRNTLSPMQRNVRGVEVSS